MSDKVVKGPPFTANGETPVSVTFSVRLSDGTYESSLSALRIERDAAQADAVSAKCAHDVDAMNWAVERDALRARVDGLVKKNTTQLKRIDTALGITADERQEETGEAGIVSAVTILLKKCDTLQAKLQEEEKVTQGYRDQHVALHERLEAAAARIERLEAELAQANSAMAFSEQERDALKAELFQARLTLKDLPAILEKKA